VSEVEIFVEPVEVPTDRAAVRRGIEASHSTSPADRVRRGLALYNLSIVEPIPPLNVYLRDAEQEIQGGLLGRTGNSALFIESLWVAEPLRRRGFGKQLVLTAEREAVQRGCRFSHLDTYSFQAPDFYRQLGYEVFGVLTGYAGGHTRYFMKKPLA
jgi:ribosomal protein S18 acetylase RimI-like enzyme